MKKQKLIYLDHAATTPVKPEVLEQMLPWFSQHYGNPSSTIYGLGRESHEAVEQSRKTVADCLGAKPEEIFFTGCGTESDNWAIRGSAYAKRKKGSHIITSAFEHHAVLHTCMQLEKEGFSVTYLKPDTEGIIHPEQVEQAIRPDTILISIMFANNEIGTLQPISQIGAIARRHDILFHTDAVQAVGMVPVDVNALQVDLLSLSAHKFYGPKGAGALYIRKGVRPDIFIQGGAQESGRRGGTENVAGIVGMAAALRLSCGNLEKNINKITENRDYLIDEILKKIPYSRLNGHRTKRLPGNANISFPYIEGESLLIWLDLNGIAASSGSACTSGSLDPSHVLLSIGLPHEIAHGSLRLTLGEENTREELDLVIGKLAEIVKKLRSMSPLYEAIQKGEQ